MVIALLIQRMHQAIYGLPVVELHAGIVFNKAISEYDGNPGLFSHSMTGFIVGAADKNQAVYPAVNERGHAGFQQRWGKMCIGGEHGITQFLRPLKNASGTPGIVFGGNILKNYTDDL